MASELNVWNVADQALLLKKWQGLLSIHIPFQSVVPAWVRSVADGKLMSFKRIKGHHELTFALLKSSFPIEVVWVFLNLSMVKFMRNDFYEISSMKLRDKESWYSCRGAEKSRASLNSRRQGPAKWKEGLSTESTIVTGVTCHCFLNSDADTLLSL